MRIENIDGNITGKSVRPRWRPSLGRREKGLSSTQAPTASGTALEPFHHEAHRASTDPFLYFLAVFLPRLFLPQFVVFFYEELSSPSVNYRSYMGCE